MMLLTCSLMSKYTPVEDTVQGHRVVRPACGRGRGRGRSTKSRATSLTIGGVSDNSGKSLINTRTRPSTWFTQTHLSFLECLMLTQVVSFLSPEESAFSEFY